MSKEATKNAHQSQPTSHMVAKRKAVTVSNRQDETLDVKNSKREEIGKLAKSEIESLRKRLQRLNDENDELLDKLSFAKRQNESKEAAFDEERLKLKQHITKLGNKLKTLQSSEEENREKLALNEQMQKDVYRLKIDLEVAEKARKEVEKREQVVCDELNELKQRLGDQDVDKNEKLTKIRNAFENQIRVIKEERRVVIAAMDAQNNRLKVELDENIQLIDELKSQKFELQQKLSGIAEDHQKEYHQKLIQQSKTIEDMLSENEKLRFAYEHNSKKLNSEIASLRKTLDERDREISLLKKQLASNHKPSTNDSENSNDNFDDFGLDRLFSLDIISDVYKKDHQKLVSHELHNLVNDSNETKLLRQQLSKRTDELNELKSELKRLQESNRRNKKELIKTQMQKDKELMAAVEALQKFKYEVGQMSISATSEADALKEVRQLKEKLTLKSQKLKEMKRELLSCKNNLKDLESNSTTVKSTLHQENLKLRQTLRDGENKLKAVKESLAATTSELSKTQKEVNRFRTEAEEFNKSKLEAYAKESESFKAEVKSSAKAVPPTATKECANLAPAKEARSSDPVRAIHSEAAAATEAKSTQQFNEILEKNRKLEQALVRLKLANDELAVKGSQNKLDSTMKRLILEKEAHIFDLQSKVTALRQILNKRKITNGADLESFSENNEFEKDDAASDIDILTIKYQDILNAHRKLLEETALLRSADERRSEQPLTTEFPKIKTELVRTKGKLRDSLDRITQLEGWLDDIYSDPHLGLGPRPKGLDKEGQMDADVKLPRLRNSESSPERERRQVRFSTLSSSQKGKQPYLQNNSLKYTQRR